MGSKRQKRQDPIDLGDKTDDYRYETESIRQSNGNRGWDRGWNEDWTSAIPNNKHDDEGQGLSDAQTDHGF